MSLRHQTNLSRRNALKALGLATAASAAYPLGPGLTGKVTAGTAERLASKRFTLGVLLPALQRPGSPGASFKAGMELHLEQINYQCAGHAIKLAVQDTGKGVLRAANASRDLIEKEKAALVVGLVNPRTSQWLRDIHETTGTPFIEASAGERITNREDSSPWIFHNSLALWQSSLALGGWGARTIGRKAVIASSFYDSGFDTLAAFRHGFEQAGGTVTDILVSEPFKGMTHADVAGAIAEAHPDLVCAFYSRGDAADFVKAYAGAGLNGRIPLLGSGFIAEEQEIAAMGSTGLGMRSALSWSEGIDTDENRKFIASYRAMHGAAPDPFALLGYDTARMVCAALQSLGKGGNREDLRRALGEVRFTSPRGELAMDSATRTLLSPLYLSEVHRTGMGVGNRIIRTFSPVEGMTEAPLLAGQRGWLNSYLTV